ncbi:MAG TPA: MFS transporter, partial [Vicinamibacteria bacterium]
MKETSRWPTVGLLFVTATAGYLCRVNISTAGALLMEEFRLSQAQMGTLFSAFLLGYALRQIPAGVLADGFGPKRTLAVAALAWTVLTVAQSAVVANAVVVLLVLRFLLGVTAAPTYPGAAAGVAQWIPASHQGRATGIVMASIGLGSALAPPLVSSLMVRFGWRAAIAISAVPAFLVALGWTRISDSTPRTVPHRSNGTAAPGRLRGWSFLLL